MWMLTADLKRKHLHHWRTWLANMENDGIDENGKPHHFVGTKILEAMSRDKECGDKRLTDTSNYWICTGIVRPHHIIQCQHISYVAEGRGASRIR